MLLSVEEAQDIILRNIDPVNRETVRPLTGAHMAVLSREANARDDVPPFTNSSMDGYAVRADDITGATEAKPTTLTVIGTARAGHPVFATLKPGQCFKIMTGAPVPDSADTVVPVEWTAPGDRPDTVKILKKARKGLYLRRKGEDMRRGQVVAPATTVITSPVMGMLATIGIDQVPIVDPPRVAILATGDELREPGQPLELGTIRNSNSYALYGAILEAGGQPILYPSAPDNAEAIQALFQQAAHECDLLVSSGGVSVGDFDFVKSVIESLGHLTMWRVNLKPGKPLAFGDVLGVPIIGLPGNPVSALITFELFVRPAIRTLLGETDWERPRMRLPLLTDFTSHEDRRQYVRCRLLSDNGQLALWPHDNQGSAVQTSWQNVDALMIVPENTGPYHAGDMLDALMLSLAHVRPRHEFSPGTNGVD